MYVHVYLYMSPTCLKTEAPPRAAREPQAWRLARLGARGGRRPHAAQPLRSRHLHVLHGLHIDTRANMCVLYLHEYAYMYIYTDVFMSVCLSVCLSAALRTCCDVCTYVCLYVCSK